MGLLANRRLYTGPPSALPAYVPLPSLPLEKYAEYDSPLLPKMRYVNSTSRRSFLYLYLYQCPFSTFQPCGPSPELRFLMACWTIDICWARASVPSFSLRTQKRSDARTSMYSVQRCTASPVPSWLLSHLYLALSLVVFSAELSRRSRQRL